MTTGPQKPAAPIKMIRSAAVLARVPYTARHLLNLEKKGAFPKRRQLGPRCVAWIESEIDEWLAGRATGPAATPFPQSQSS